MLSVNHIRKAFNPGTVNEISVFKDFSLEVEEGQFVSIIGSNGSGKTTLLNLICGSLQPDSGSITINDVNISSWPDHKRYRKIGRVFQSPGAGTAPSMTLLENLSMADNKGKSWKLTPGIDKDRIESYRALLAPLGLGLENKLADRVDTFSGGQRQAVALLMATMQPIDFLILDEHTAALDPKTADTIMELTQQIVESKGLTALMVTHNLRNSLDYGDRLLMMHDGCAVLDASGAAKQALVLDEILDKFYEISIERGNSL